MKNTLLLTAIAIAYALSGCAAGTVKPINDLTATLPTSYKEKALDFVNKEIRPHMKDPSAMKIVSIGPLEKVNCENDKKDRYKAWSTIVLINGKNSYGAYTGATPYQLWFLGNRIKNYASPELMELSEELGITSCFF